MKKPLPVVIERPLGKERAYGQSHGYGLIEIDPRLNARGYLEILIHEALHERFHNWKESKVSSTAKFLCRMIWRQGFRRIQE